MNEQPTGAPTEASIAQMFNSIAPRYDLLNTILSFNQDKRWRRHMVKHVPNKLNGVFVDVATGTGDVLLLAAKKHREYAAFIGIDISSGMLEHARQKSASLDRDHTITLKLGSAEATGLAANSCDCLSIAFGLRNTINKDKVLEEFHRVLKPGGTLLILDFFPPRGSLLARLFQWYFHRILPVIGGLFSSRSAYQYLPNSVQTFYQAPQLQEKLHKTGFYAVKIYSFLFGACRLFVAKK